MKSHRSYVYDPTPLIVKILWPLLILNGALWIGYAKVPVVGAAWFLALIATIFWMRRNG